MGEHPSFVTDGSIEIKFLIGIFGWEQIQGQGLWNYDEHYAMRER